jgi:YD repeat-containing protein
VGGQSLREVDLVIPMQGGSVLLLELVESPTVVLDPAYDVNGVLESLLVAAPAVNGQFSEWLQTQYDDLGNVTQVSDFSGANTSFSYDENGDLIQLTSNEGSVSLTRNTDGAVTEVNTSWGYQQTNTYR